MRNKKGLTLMELLIVVLILGVLTAIAVPRISQSTTTARINACNTNVDILNSQIEMYNADTGAYPVSLATVNSDPNYFPDGAVVCPSGGTLTMSGTIYRVSCDFAGH